MSTIELENYNIIDDQVANELRVEDTGAASTVLTISDGSDELQVDSLSTVDAADLGINSPVNFNNNDLKLGGAALTNASEIQFNDNSSDGNNWRMLEDGSSSYLNISISGTEHFKITNGGPVELPNHKLLVSGAAEILTNGNINIEGTLTESTTV